MNYAFDISTPANTLQSAPQVTRVRLQAGRISQVVFYFPPGSAGLNHIRVRHGGHQLWPYNQDADYSGDDCIFTMPEDIPIRKQSWQVAIETWNTDDTFAHRVMVMITVLEEMTPPPWVIDVLKSIQGTTATSARAQLGGTIFSILGASSKST